MAKIEEGLVRKEIHNNCAFCDAPVASFVQVSKKWMGTPVLYMGIHPITNSALAFQFCDADCLIEWLAEILGMEVS